jgi:drug/metabolite transporter (DMT)-like permease
LTQGYVLLLPLIAGLSARRWPPRRILGCAALAVFGLTVLSGFEPATLTLGRGEAETLGAALCFTAQILLLDHAGFAQNRTAPVSNVMFFTVAALAAPVALGNLRDGSDVLAVVGTSGALVIFLMLFLFSTLFAFVLMNRFQRVVTASEAGIIYGMEPVFASLFALGLPSWLSSGLDIAYQNEELGARLLLGGSMVVAATVGLSLFDRAERQAASSSAAA